MSTHKHMQCALITSADDPEKKPGDNQQRFSHTESGGHSIQRVRASMVQE